MKNIANTILILLLITTSFSAVVAQGCLAGGVIFSSQSEIDAFTSNYPGCSQILGNLRISGEDIISLDSLYRLHQIDGSLIISNNYILTGLSGLDSLVSVGGELRIESNGELLSLHGLDSLGSVGGALNIQGNANLPALSGLDHLETVGGFLNISSNYSLLDLAGLGSLSSFVGYLQIVGNESLTSLNGLSNVTHISGFLYIRDNTNLANLNGLNNITSIGGNFDVRFNPSLTSLSGLESLTSVGGFFLLGPNDLLENLSGLSALSSTGGSFFSVGGNYSLSSISGLSALTHTGPEISIEDNPMLTSLSGLDNINNSFLNALYIRNCATLSVCEVESICSYLALPGNSATISGNASGCASRAEVTAACTALPVELSAFSVRNSADGALLEWETASEENCARFEIQHSTDGTTFYALESVPGQGHSTTPRAYRFIHQNPVSGNNYYRLRQIDFDQTARFSPIISLTTESDDIRIFPNPGAGIITLKSGSNSTRTLKIINWSGREVYTETIESSRVDMDLSDLGNGIYFIEIQEDNTSGPAAVIRKKLIINQP